MCVRTVLPSSERASGSSHAPSFISPDSSVSLLVSIKQQHQAAGKKQQLAASGQAESLGFTIDTQSVAPQADCVTFTVISNFDTKNLPPVLLQEWCFLFSLFSFTVHCDTSVLPRLVKKKKTLRQAVTGSGGGRGREEGSVVTALGPPTTLGVCVCVRE